MRKAQMELMGLAIIVILLSVGLLFLVRFVVLKEPTDLRETYHKSELASNLVSTLLSPELTTDCDDESLATLLQDCAGHYDSSGRIECDNVPRTNPPGQAPTPFVHETNADLKSCQFSYDVIGYTMQETLQKWGNRGYTLTICVWDPVNQKCVKDSCDSEVGNPKTNSEPYNYCYSGAGEAMYVVFNNSKCDDDVEERKSAAQPLSLYRYSKGTLMVLLDVCG